MPYPPLVRYETESQYRTYFERVYCKKKIVTFDGIPVKFKKADFNHAFFESTRDKDDTFSRKRAQRIDWIKSALAWIPMDYVAPNAKRRMFTFFTAS